MPHPPPPARLGSRVHCPSYLRPPTVCVCVCAACICLNFNELSSRKLQSYEEAAFHLPLDDLRLELQILMAAVANSNLEAALAICSLSQSILAAAPIATAPGTGTAARAAIRACRKLLFWLPLQLPQFALLSQRGRALCGDVCLTLPGTCCKRESWRQRCPLA